MTIFLFLLATLSWIAFLFVFTYWWTGRFESVDKLIYIHSDGGRCSSSYPWEQNDCTVRALANVISIPYDKAYMIMAEMGREPNLGLRNTCGRIRKRLRWRGKLRTGTLGWFVKHATGRWLVTISGHALALIDGVIWDEIESDPTAIVTGAVQWRH